VVDKPAGWTSHDVVGRARRLVGTRKVGHAGTLDPMATGVLVLGIERATKLLGHLALDTKTYLATIRLGLATSTDDAEGEAIGASSDASGLTEQAIADGIAALTGEIAQVPSSVSAIKVDGRRAYERARAGEEVRLEARPVAVTRFDVLASRAEGPFRDLDVLVDCSSGTYVRALARDLGAALGTGGHLTALRRLRSGPFTVTEAEPLGDDPPRLLPLADAVRRCFSVLDLDGPTADAVRHGRRLTGLDLPADRTALFAPSGEFLALYRRQPGEAVPEAVFV
jgi:tRNA pseudouridine55 synthase